MTNHAKRAVALFEQGYGCAQATAAAFAEELGVERALLLRVTAGLGAGRGGLRETCGAVSAMAIVAGLAAAPFAPDDLAAKQALYARIRELDEAFVRRHGTTVCAQLLARAGVPAGPGPSARTAEYYAARPCSDLVATAAELLAGMLLQRAAPR